MTKPKIHIQTYIRTSAYVERTTKLDRSTCLLRVADGKREKRKSVLEGIANSSGARSFSQKPANVWAPKQKNPKKSTRAPPNLQYRGTAQEHPPENGQDAREQERLPFAGRCGSHPYSGGCMNQDYVEANRPVYRSLPPVVREGSRERYSVVQWVPVDLPRSPLFPPENVIILDDCCCCCCCCCSKGSCWDNRWFCHGRNTACSSSSSGALACESMFGAQQGAGWTDSPPRSTHSSLLAAVVCPISHAAGYFIFLY